VDETLTLLQEAGYILGVATGKSRRGLLATLETHDLRKYFVTLQTADVAPGKPHPGMMQRAMAETGVEKDETVLIGDTVFDMEMARNAGTHAYGVSWGYHEVDELHAAGAHLVLDHLSELPPLLAQPRKEN
jgi:phosphoglycolate phosphatase